MRNGEITTINGAWSEDANAWVSEALCLTGDCWLEVVLPEKGRLVVKKSETSEGPWPKCLITPWTGPEMRIRFYGSTKYRYVKLYLTEQPTRLQFANTKGFATGETIDLHL